MNKREFSKLFNEHIDAVYRFAYWRVGDEAQAEDIASTVFTKAWEKRDSFDNKNAKAWLFTIARNIVIDGYRKKHDERLPEDFEGGQEDATAEDFDKALDAATLYSAMQTLPEDLRSVLHWRFIEQESVADTAAHTGLTEANVRVMQFRALKKLRIWYEKRK